MIDTGRLREEFLQEVRVLIGKPCWAFYAGPSTGSIVSFDFGEKIPRRVPLLNPKLSEDERYHFGEVSLFIECAWRLDSSDTVICGSTDSNDNEGPMQRGLELIVGRTVKSVKVEPPACDLTIGLDGNFTLKVFCDQTNVEEGYDNYSLHVKDRIYIVGPRGRIRYELRTNDSAR